MKSSIASIAASAIFLLTGTYAAADDNYDCGTEQAAIRQRAHEIKADAQAKKVNDQNGCAYQRELADLTDRQAAFLLNCYQGLKLTRQNAEDRSLLLAVSAKNMRAQCSQAK